MPQEISVPTIDGPATRRCKRAPLSALLRRGWLLAAWSFSCSSVSGVSEKPCQPGCVDSTTRLECGADGAPRSVPCPTSSEECAAPVCEAGSCRLKPAVGAPCGPDGGARCNEGYACIGPGVHLSAIRQHTCIVADDGKVWCWGNNQRSELGDGTAEDRGNPVLVRGLPGPATSVTAGYAHTCVLSADGKAYCWGDNTGGQTAPTSMDNPVTAPTLVDTDVAFTAIVAGQGHTCGIAADATVYCWGNTSAGQCGVDPKETNQVGPTKIPGLDHVRLLETVKNHICAVRTLEPTLVCWGSNQYLEEGGYIVHKLGPGAATLEYSPVPVPVDLGTNVVDVGMGYESTYAIGADGLTYAWGYNSSGQLGTESKESFIATPGPVMESPGQPQQHALDVLRSDGSDQCAEVEGARPRYVCWGKDDHGELGFGIAGFQRFQFAKATTVLPDTAAHLVRGEDHGCMTVTEDGTVAIWCYGKQLFVASGSLDPNLDQELPAPVQWDPENFSPALEQ